MAGEPVITIVGNLGGDPELRFTSGGHAVTNFSVAQTPRTRNQQSGEWVDDEALWFRCTAWREAAENVAETLTKGMRVIVTGRLRASAFEDKQGNQRVGWEMQVDEVGPSLRWATAQVTRSQPNNNGGFANQNYQNNDPWGGSQYAQQNPQQNPQGNVWGNPPQNQPGQGAWGQPPQQNQQPPQNQPPQQGQPPQQQNPQQNGNVWAGNQPQQGNPPQTDAFGFQSDGPPPF